MEQVGDYREGDQKTGTEGSRWVRGPRNFAQEREPLIKNIKKDLQGKSGGGLNEGGI